MAMCVMRFDRAESHLLLPMIDLTSYGFAEFGTVFVSDPFDPTEHVDDCRRKIYVYTATGNSNRAKYADAIERQQQYDGYLYDYERPNSVLMIFVYEVPDRWHADFDLIEQQHYEDVSSAYKQHACEIYHGCKLRWDFPPKI